jgi:glyoxylase-like metal-dependent hydrolase (beta-lactamase superfamily II)
MTIHTIAVPTPFLVGRVNCYLVEDDPLTLVDTGPNSGRALDELEQGLRALGHRIEDLERIVVTHQHIDHIGLLSILARRSGAEVCGLDHLAPFLADFGPEMEREDEMAESLMLRHGIPEEMVTVLRAVSRAMRGWGSSGHITHRLSHGDTLEFANRTWEVLHRPGHSPSDTLFHDAERRELIAGDHLIAHISSNPLIARPLGGRSGEPGDRPRALLTYMDSLRETREMDLARVLPGHGEIFGDHAALIDDRFRMHERRARKIAGLIADEPKTVHEIAHDLWGKVAVTQAYLTMCEVLGHIDLLAERGEVVEEERDGVARFRAAGSSAAP